MKKVFIALMMPLIVSVSVPAQTMGSFSGKVVDSSGEPLIGAGVVIKGTTNGSATDYDGNYNRNAKKIYIVNRKITRTGYTIFS